MNDDLIKRSDAIEMLQEAIMAYPPVMKGCGETRDSTLEEAINLILDIPSADRPQGEWLKFGLGRGTRILFCTNCERRIEVPLSQGNLNYDFCPNCGADMREREDE